MRNMERQQVIEFLNDNQRLACQIKSYVKHKFNYGREKECHL
jgi:hypothetical protein